MGSSRQQDRSLGSGLSLPQWMKGKIDNRFDFDESTFSPPSHDDSFFCIRYLQPSAQAKSEETSQEFRSINEVLSSNKRATLEQQADGKEQKQIDFTKHPPPCQPFVPSNVKAQEVKQPRTVIAGKPKSQGTDDGYHGEPALCGKSIVHVANQMMSSKLSKVFSSDVRADQQLEQYQQPRKVSKSLPATPLASPLGSPDTSPKSRRKVYTNRYFTGPFIPDREKFPSGWILSSILGQSRELVSAKIDEEDENALDIAPPKPLNRKKSISSQNLTYIGKEIHVGREDEKANEKLQGHTNVFQPKPSELREMNFWSPTSM